MKRSIKTMLLCALVLALAVTPTVCLASEGGFDFGSLGDLGDLGDIDLSGLDLSGLDIGDLEGLDLGDLEGLDLSGLDLGDLEGFDIGELTESGILEGILGGDSDNGEDAGPAGIQGFLGRIWAKVKTFVNKIFSSIF